MELTKISDEASPLPFEEDLQDYDMEDPQLVESGILQDEEELKEGEKAQPDYDPWAVEDADGNGPNADSVQPQEVR